mmetsp:Transcript_50185/g.92710  ORF Transcript_50185/g.92710 Transcript_50185/m.92710 type:complete len:337 (-) Transcript_50185:7-1017(-)
MCSSWPSVPPSPEAWDDDCLVKQMCANNGYALQHASDRLRGSYDIVMTAVSANGYSLQYATADLQANPNVVSAAIAQAGTCLQFASDALRADRDTVWLAVCRNGDALKYAADALRSDKDLVLKAVQSQYGSALCHAALDLCDDKDIVHEAVRRNGQTLRFSSERLRSDRAIVLTAVSSAGDALQYASDALRADRDLVLRAVAQNSRALQYASDDLLLDEAFLSEVDAVYILLRVTMISGRSCVLVHFPEWSDLCVDDQDDRIAVVDQCHRRLGLTGVRPQQLQLWSDASPIPACPIQCWPGVEYGCVNELQLVVLAEDVDEQRSHPDFLNIFPDAS